ncbi:hypothetical protein GCM10023195_59970 [Actinoallomurus liliacearum]|uniref:Uncharacterized protein n=1 Tax=Actinoallomurus liliacearum TaxID=1080073 RepID=A0ABP8TQJ5_9ACTN
MNMRITPPAGRRKGRAQDAGPIRRIRPAHRPVPPRPRRGKKGR